MYVLKDYSVDDRVTSLNSHRCPLCRIDSAEVRICISVALKKLDVSCITTF